MASELVTDQSDSSVWQQNLTDPWSGIWASLCKAEHTFKRKRCSFHIKSIFANCLLNIQHYEYLLKLCVSCNNKGTNRHKGGRINQWIIHFLLSKMGTFPFFYFLFFFILTLTHAHCFHKHSTRKFNYTRKGPKIKSKYLNWI